MSQWSLETQRAYPDLGCRGLFREEVEDFVVEEVLGLELSGEGEHVFLLLEKINLNTDEVAQRIARLAKVRHMDVGYSGMKDKRAVARQWFSVYLGNRPEPDWSAVNRDDLKLVEVTRHRQKLRRGQHLGNRFVIRLRELEGNLGGLQQVLEQVRERGFPNYFGEQRFGIHGANLDRAENLFRGELRQRDPHKRGLYTSAARSWLFNQVLKQRVADQTWSTMLDGEMPVAVPRHDFDDLFEVPSGPLYGDAPIPSSGQVLLTEQAVADANPLFIEGLMTQRMRPDRRPLVAYPMGFHWELDDRILTLRFSLSAGSFATALLTELLQPVARWYDNKAEAAAPINETESKL